MNYELLTLFSNGFNGICTASKSQLQVKWDNFLHSSAYQEIYLFTYIILFKNFKLLFGKDPSNFHYKNQKDYNVGGKERIISMAHE